MSTKVPLLVTPKELSERLASSKHSSPVVLDASWHMPNLQPPRDGFQEFRKERILGAGFWHHDIIADKSSQLPHMLPSPNIFADAASRLGITRDDHVVFYDTNGVFSSPRAAWVFRAFGHERVSVLDGGLPRWKAEGLSVDTTEPSHINPHSTVEPIQPNYRPIMSELLYAKRPKVESYFIQDIEDHFSDYPVPQLDETAVRSYDQIVRNSKAKSGEIVLDARPAGRWHGTDPEPRAGLSSGHIPKSLSLPFTSVLSQPSESIPSYRTMLSPDEIEQVMEQTMGAKNWSAVKAGKKSVVGSCGSGMTAAVLWLALQTVGASRTAIYDESWTGYAGRQESIIEKS